MFPDFGVSVVVRFNRAHAIEDGATSPVRSQSQINPVEHSSPHLVLEGPPQVSAVSLQGRHIGKVARHDIRKVNVAGVVQFQPAKLAQGQHHANRPPRVGERFRVFRERRGDELPTVGFSGDEQFS